MKENKMIAISLFIIMVVIIIMGGTYAYLSTTLSIDNAIFNTETDCFTFDYNDNTDLITGVIFPSANPSGGLKGSVTIKVNSTCKIIGVGTLKLNINNETSSIFSSTTSPHCENTTTLATIKKINGNAATSSNCTGGTYSWVTNGKALKYAIYDNNEATGNPLSVGYINYNPSLQNNEIALYTNFDVTLTSKTYYIYIWLDGNITDNSHNNLKFSANVVTTITQKH